MVNRTESRTQSDENKTHSRGQSEVFGVVLLLALSMLTIGMIFVFGQPAISEANEGLSSERTDNEFSLLDSRVATTALGATQVQDFTLNIGDGTLIADPDAANIRITQNYTEGESDNRTLFTTDIGHIRNEKPDGEVVAYEGGGVWRSEPGSDSARMVSSPELHYEGQTLTMPLFNVNNSLATSGDRRSIQVRTDRTQRWYPMSEDEQRNYASQSDPPEVLGDIQDPDDDDVENRDNPLTNGSILVTVQSEFYDGWQTYFESRTEGEVIDRNDAENEVTVELTVPVSPIELDKGGVFEGGCDVRGAASCDDTFDEYETGVRLPGQDSWIDAQLSEAESNGVDYFGGCSDCGAELYYQDSDVTIGGDSFDVEDNTVTLAVDGDVEFDGTVEVDGTSPDNDNRLQIIATGDLEFRDSGAGMNTQSQNTSKMVISTKSGNEIEFRGNLGSDIYGVLYSPGSTVEFRGAPQWTWHGTIAVSDFTNRGNPGTVETEEELTLNTQSIDDPITFLHITENKIDVE